MDRLRGPALCLGQLAGPTACISPPPPSPVRGPTSIFACLVKNLRRAILLMAGWPERQKPRKWASRRPRICGLTFAGHGSHVSGRRDEGNTSLSKSHNDLLSLAGLEGPL